MPPGPVGISPGLSTLVEPGGAPVPDDAAIADRYDRSSLAGDFMATIAGQTEADWLRRAPDMRCEFIDGIVSMPSCAGHEPPEDVNLILFLVNYYHAIRPGGSIATGPAVPKFRDDCRLEPDLFLVPDAVQVRLREERVDRPPVLLVVEVLGRSNRCHDLGIKARLYREAQGDEIWSVDRADRVVIVERRGPAGYVMERVEVGPAWRRSLPGIWGDAAWRWADPPANSLTCTNAILAGPPGA